MLFILFLLFVLTLFFEYRVKSPFFLFVLVSQSIYILSCTYFNNMYPDWVESEVEYLGFIFFSVYLISRFFIYSVFFNDLKINNEFSVEWLIKPVVYVSGLSLFISLFLFDFDIFSSIKSNS